MSIKWTTEEEEELRKLVDKHGNAWSFIAKEIGRTADGINKKARSMGILSTKTIMMPAAQPNRAYDVKKFTRYDNTNNISNPGNVLVIGDTHIPYERKWYLNHCVDTYNRYGCKTVIHIGDVVDNHMINYHEKEPGCMGADDELDMSIGILKEWVKEFPCVNICIGNHDELIMRKAKTAGMPTRMTPHMNSIYELPDSWVWSYEITAHGVMFKHGSGKSGKYAHRNHAEENMKSCVTGHLHSNAGIEYISTPDKIVVGMNVGCGIDRRKDAFAYGKQYRRPIVSCGVVLDEGTRFIVEPMKLNKGE